MTADERHEDLLWGEHRIEVDDYSCVRGGGGAWCRTHSSIWLWDGRPLCAAAFATYLAREIPDHEAEVTIGLVPSLRAYAGCLAFVIVPWVLIALLVIVVDELV